MSLNDLTHPNAFDDDSEEDEEMYIPIPFRFHDLAQRDEAELLDEEIKKNSKRDYNPNEVTLSLDQEDNYGFTPLHIAIMRGNINTIRVCIDNGVNRALQTEGVPYSIFLLLVAASTTHFRDNVWNVLNMLVIPDNMDTMCDRLGRTIAHMAAAYNRVDLLEKILQEYPTLLERVDLEGNSILHAACKSNSVDSIQFLMDSYPDIASITNHNKQNALHICLEWNAIESYQTLIRIHSSDLDVHAEDALGRTPLEQWKKVMETKREKGTSEFPHEAAKTLILIPEPYDRHQTCANPPKRTEKLLPAEQIQRLNVLVNEEYGGSLLESSLAEKVVFMKEEGMVELSHLLRVHDFNYLMKIMNACSKAKASGLHNVDQDTVVSPKSFDQARCAAKVVCRAVDELSKTTNTVYRTGDELSKATTIYRTGDELTKTTSTIYRTGDELTKTTSNTKFRNVFCCIRPPGHHIGTNGAVNNPNNPNVSQGFCLFNNVAVAAAYARSHYPQFSRIAILDIDIHHGNGTEDCIQHLCPCEKTTVHTVDNMQVKYTNYQYKPWLNEEDSKNVFFASIHGYGKLAPTGTDYFYPGSGSTQNKMEYVKSTGIEFTKPEIVDTFVSKQQATSSFFWRENLRLNVLPRLLAFHPDLIFLSSGFDGHKNDLLNNGFGGLTETDFAYITGEVIKVANTVCEGRVISVLEGGYNILGGCASPLALSVQAHVEALTAHYYEECDPEEWKKSSESERAVYEQLARERGEVIQEVDTVRQVPLNGIQETSDVEEESFDFEAMSEEEQPLKPVREPTPLPVPPVENKPSEGFPDEDESEDLVNYDMPEIEEGELDKIIDPLANEIVETEPTGRRKRSRAKVDYVALEAQLRKEEEEMRMKQMKDQE